jgi:LPXTG-motif cell wall-anchored protein
VVASSVPGVPAPASATDATPIVALVVVLGILVGAGLLLARRRRAA